MMSRLSARYLFGIFYSVDRDQARVSQSPLIQLFSLPEHLRLIYSFRSRCVNVVEASSRPTAGMTTRKKKKGVRLKKNLGVDALFTFFDDRWSLVSLRMSQWMGGSEEKLEKEKLVECLNMCVLCMGVREWKGVSGCACLRQGWRVNRKKIRSVHLFICASMSVRKKLWGLGD